MRCVAIVKSSKESEAGRPAAGKEVTTMGQLNDGLINAAVMLAGEELQAGSKCARVRFEKGGKKTVSDGAFAETKELVGGFWLWQVKSKEEAIEWLKRARFGNNEEVEIRQVFEA